MGYLDDDVNQDPIVNYENKMGFELRDDNFVYADAHFLVRHRAILHLPKWLSESLVFTHHVHRCVIAFQPKGLLIIGLKRFIDYADDFQNVQYYFSGHNYFIPHEVMTSATLVNQKRYKSLTIATKYQSMHFFIPSILRSRPFQSDNYANVQKMVADMNEKR